MRIATVFSMFFLAGGIAAMADGVLQDPQILIDTGCCSIGMKDNLGTVQPTGDASVTYDFFNDTGNIVTSFKFQTMVNPGLSSTTAQSFTCADPGGFFLHCDTSYDPSNGNLIYSFFGVDPADGDEGGTDPETGEHEGIPVGSPEGSVGHFIITLNGWTTGATSNGQTLYNDLPTLENTFTEAPEPSYAVILGVGLLALVVVRRVAQQRAAR